jgi:hypothetical protein
MAKDPIDHRDLPARIVSRTTGRTPLQTTISERISESAVERECANRSIAVAETHIMVIDNNRSLVSPLARHSPKRLGGHYLRLTGLLYPCW